MNNSRKWLIRTFDVITTVALLLPGLFLLVIASVFNDYGGPPTSDEQAETARLVIFGLSLIVTAIIMPLRSKKRAIIGLLLITVTAMLILFMDGGQPDVAFTYFVILGLSLPLYLMRKRITKV